MVRYLAARGHEILQIRAGADLKNPEKRPVLEDIDLVMISIFPIPEGFLVDDNKAHRAYPITGLRDDLFDDWM